MEFIKNNLDSSQVVIAVMGGDGGISYSLKELAQNKIPIEKV